MRLPVNHPTLGRTNYEATPIRDDPEGRVADTISLMQRYVREDADSDEVLQALAESGALASPAPIGNVFWWVKSRLKFVQDEDTARPWQGTELDVVEVLIRPRDMYSLQVLRQGDCDDYVMMGAAMLRRLGVPVNFVTVAADPRDTSSYSHVYLAAYPNGNRISLDASHGPYVGWEVPDKEVFKKREWQAAGMPSWIWIVGAIGAITYVGKRRTGIA